VQPVVARAPRLADAVDADTCTPNGTYYAFYATNYSTAAFYYANLNFLTYGTSNGFDGFVWALADMTLAGMASDNVAAGNCATAKDQYLAAGNAGVNAFNFELADFSAVGQVLAFSRTSTRSICTPALSLPTPTSSPREIQGGARGRRSEVRGPRSGRHVSLNQARR
jgi:hypothetical protein